MLYKPNLSLLINKQIIKLIDIDKGEEVEVNRCLLSEMPNIEFKKGEMIYSLLLFLK
jgi:hypothetical protein